MPCIDHEDTARTRATDHGKQLNKMYEYAKVEAEAYEIFVKRKPGMLQAVEDNLFYGTYAGTPTLDLFASALCELLSKIEENDAAANKIIYDGRNKQARELAEWWEEHQKVDAQRRKYESDVDELREMMDELSITTYDMSANNWPGVAPWVAIELDGHESRFTLDGLKEFISAVQDRNY